MPDRNHDITHFSRYFNIEAPKSGVQAVLFVILGVVTGIVSSFFVHLHQAAQLSWLLSGVSLGIIAITIPSMLTVFFIKAVKRGMKLKHAFFGVLAISFLYSCFVIMDSALFSLLHNYILAYLFIILLNAFIYGYWFLVNRVVMNQRRTQIVTAAFQPVVNVLLFLPVSKYLFGISPPVGSTLVKLWGGMIVFMFVGYVILYIMDKPAKRELNLSGVDLLTAMVNQWMYDITKDGDLKSTGVKKDIKVGILALRGRKGYKAIFVNPEIHYGPFHDIGGSVATQRIGRKLEEEFRTVPFITHGAVGFEDNPVSTQQIYRMSNTIAEGVANLPKSSFKPSYGNISVGRDGPCSAIGVHMNDSCILALTKAPLVTEDISRDIGERFAGIARKKFRNVMLIDAHNSRIESAQASELNGIQPDSKYVPMYERAIDKMLHNESAKRPLSFGASSERLSRIVKKHDMGEGYTSVGVFGFGRKKFCIMYFDANNMLPSFRAEVLGHLKERFGLDAEVCTTDTHSVNTIALPASNVLGRETKPSEVIPTLDKLVASAIKSMEKVSCSYSSVEVKDFKVWGRGTEDALVKVSREVIRTGKRKVPLIIAAGVIIAAWVIYLA